LRNRVHLAVTPQTLSPGVYGQRVPSQRPAAERQDQGRPAVAGAAGNPAADDPALRRMVQAVPNQLR